MAQMPFEYDQMRVTNKYMIQIKHNKLRIPTGGRLTSWLFKKRGGAEFGAISLSVKFSVSSLKMSSSWEL